MAPAPTPRAYRPLAKPSKIRYFKGKAPDAAISSDEDDSDVDVAPPEPVKLDKTLVAGGAGRIVKEPAMKVALRDVKVEGGKVLVGGKLGVVKQEDEEDSEEEETDDEQEIKLKPSAAKLNTTEAYLLEYETDSEEESEEDKKPALRPVFVPKGARNMTQEKAAAEAEERIRQEEELQVQRKMDSEVKDLQPDVDDTDGVDATGEFDSWRARELARLLRDKKAQTERDEEKEEIERRRALPEEQRLREDMQYADQTRQKEKGEMGFLQKYYHKGAFHQDDHLLNRDYTAATESAVDMSMLPKIMQVRNFGKMSRTKYTHLTDQDTSQGGWGTAARPAAPGQIGTTETGCWNCGGPHQRKDCPNNSVNDTNALPGPSGMGTSANTATLGYGGGAPQRSWGGAEERNGSGGDVKGGRDGERSIRHHEHARDTRFEDERRTGVGQSKRAKTEFLGEEKMATSADTGRRRAGAEVRHDSEIESETTIDDILETMRGGVTTEIVTTGGGGADMGT
ncbi:MAG: hypothetical protein TREMPRED_005606 [Tremellales sp. Tagirdzhanova-0007]|nr:MAG: hypothetical protein TREMPRED_005606 [Tremellales sp. Tagirdzhanova-0007]